MRHGQLQRISQLRWPRMRLLWSVAIGLCCSCVGGCGSQHPDSVSTAERHGVVGKVEPGSPATYTHAPDGYVEGDSDTDDIFHSHKDEDDSAIRGYGSEASASELAVVDNLVKLYYEAAAHQEGARACTLIYGPVARSRDFANVVPEAYADVSSSSLFRDRSCAEVESEMFELNLRTLREGAASVRVSTLRVHGAHGIAILSFKTIPEYEIAVEREHGHWTIDALLDNAIV